MLSSETESFFDASGNGQFCVASRQAEAFAEYPYAAGTIVQLEYSGRPLRR